VIGHASVDSLLNVVYLLACWVVFIPLWKVHRFRWISKWHNYFDVRRSKMISSVRWNRFGEPWNCQGTVASRDWVPGSRQFLWPCLCISFTHGHSVISRMTAPVLIHHCLPVRADDTSVGAPALKTTLILVLIGCLNILIISPTRQRPSH